MEKLIIRSVRTPVDVKQTKDNTFSPRSLAASPCFSLYGPLRRICSNTLSSGATTRTQKPSKTLKKEAKQQSNLEKLLDKKPQPAFGDRLFPARASTRIDLAQHRHLEAHAPTFQRDNSCIDADTIDFHKAMRRQFDGMDGMDEPILSFSVKPSSMPRFLGSGLAEGSMELPTKLQMKKRKIPTIPDRILAAPDLMRNQQAIAGQPIDWSSTNLVAVALHGCVYLWNGNDFSVSLVSKVYEEVFTATATSVSWIEAGTHLAIGTNLGEIWLYDIEYGNRIRTMRGHKSPVNIQTWNEYVISSASTNIHHYDVRVKDFHVSSTLKPHQGTTVTALAWSPTRKYLASSGLDNTVKIWAPGAYGQRHIGKGAKPLNAFNNGASALAWCPWKYNVLASGSNSEIGDLLIFDAGSGEVMNEAETGTGIASIVFSKDYRQMAVAQNSKDNDISILDFSTLQKVGILPGEPLTQIVDMVMNPNRDTVVTACLDETLNFWKCFARPGEQIDGGTMLVPPAFGMRNMSRSSQLGYNNFLR